MDPIEGRLDGLAATTGFSGVVRVDRADTTVLVRAYGDADRRYRIENRPDTRFAIASGSKGFTALAVVALIEEGALRLDTTARSVLGGDLPLIADDVTVEHLLAHRSGIGDYLDEDEETDPSAYVMPVPVHRLATTEDYLAVLDGHPTKFRAGERFSYCNGGYVVLALLAERVSGTPFHDLVERRVLRPAGMRDTAYLRSDELPERTALGYLDAEGLRTNVLHLPVRGGGDGGAYSTARDLVAFWRALFDGRIVTRAWVDEMVRARSVVSDGSRYGLGFWLAADGPGVSLEGADAGVSFRSVHDPETGTTVTVLSNTTDGAWPLAERLATG